MKFAAAWGVFLLCFAPMAQAEEPQTPKPVEDNPSVHLPVDCKFWVKLPSLERMDELALRLKPFFEKFDTAAPIRKQAPSKLIAGLVGLADAEFDKTRPILLAMRAGDAVAILPASATATTTEDKDANGMLVTRRGTFFVVGEKEDVSAPTTGVAVTLPEGDFVFHVPLARLIADNKANIDKGFEKIKDLPIPLPDNVKNLYAEVLGISRSTLDQIDSFTYSLSLSKEGRLFSTGRIATKPRSKVREMLRSTGKPGTHELLRFLPRQAFSASVGYGKADWISKELKTLLDKTMGENAGEAVQALMGPTALLSSVMGNKTASVSTMGGMFNVGAVGLAEVTDDAKAKEALAAYSPAESNKMLVELNIPLKINWEKEVFTHDDVKVHRLSFESDNQQFGAMLAMTETLIAVDSGMLLSASGTGAKTELLDLIDRLRAGKKSADHPHLTALQRLGDYHVAFTINVGALKPFAMLFAMQAPEAGQIMNAIPEQMLLSTAIRMDDGDISWKGEWPLQEMKGLLAKVAEMTDSEDAEKGLKEAEDEEDFD